MFSTFLLIVFFGPVKLTSFNFFFLDLSPGQLTSSMFILIMKLDFYKPTILISRITAHAKFQVGWTIPLSLFAPAIDPNEWFMKNGLLSRGFEPMTLQS